MKKPVKNLAASLQAQLRRRASETGRQYNEVLDYYAMEKFLARLAASPYAQRFVLKGGLLFHVWQYALRRPTRDVDLQATTENSVEYVTAIIKDICHQPVEPDGIEFNPEQITARSINLQANTQGVRVRCEAKFSDTNIKIIFNIDISFANVITPAEVKRPYPALLPNTPSFTLATYPPETAIAEKLEALVKLGVATGRLNDFFDLYVLATYSDFEGAVVARAIRATFLNRQTALPSTVPPALADSFAKTQQTEWSAYLRGMNQADSEAAGFTAVLERLRAFLLPPLHAAAANDQAFTAHWPAGGPWQG